MRKYVAIAVSFLALVYTGCSSNSASTPGPVVYFRPQQTSSGIVYRTVPFPNDLYATATGNDIAPSSDPNTSRAFMNTTLIPMLNRYKGFGTAGAVLFSLSITPDVATLPRTVQASVQPTASAFIINIDPGSPDYGNMTPAVFIFTATSYNGSDYLYTLGVLPAYGYPLEQSTRYAAVITDRVKGLNGAGLTSDLDFNMIKTGSTLSDPLLERARELYAPLFALLAKPPYNMGYARIAGASVFTTEPITPVLQHVIQFLTATTLPSPYFTSSVEPATVIPAGTFSYTTGSFTSPDYLGDPVSGTIQVGPDGDPVIRGWSTLYFSVTVPATPPPPGGYPVAIVQHGLNSDRGQIILSVADTLARHGIACIGINAVDHGDRTPPGAYPTLAFLYFQDPLAIRDHFIQTVVDLLQLSRVAQSPALTAGLSSLMGRPVTFDTTGNAAPTAYIGQSLGGIIGSLYISIAPYTKTAVINVGGGELTTLFLNSPAIYAEFMPAINAVFGIPPWIIPSLATDEVAMMQGLIDPGDSINYARFAIRQPLAATGFTKQVLFQMADLDQLVAHVSTEAEATAMGVTGIARGDGNAIILLPWFTFTTYAPPVTMNGIYQYYGTHGMLNTPTDTVDFEENYPFNRLPQPLTVTNPVAQVQEQAAQFLTTGTIIDPYTP